MTAALVLQAPPQPAGLVLLFHGVGATPQSLAPVGEQIAQAFPAFAVVSVAAPDPSDLGAGLQWFSVRGVTEANRPARVQATLPRFVATVRHWQDKLAVGPARTTLVGFSQGAIMALAAGASAQPPAARVVSLSGRFDALPDAAPAGVQFHFVHGDHDPVIGVGQASAAAQRLQQLGVPATLDLIPGLGHGIDAGALAALLRVLRP